jgi:thymidylate synthase (FAD)
VKVSLVSVTKDAVGSMTPEEIVTYTARISSPQNQHNTETGPRLLRYLIEHRHWSPFEMVDLTLEIETSRAIAAQILRHRSFSFQEFSQRYSKVGPAFEDLAARRQDEKNRQASHEDLPQHDVDWFYDAQQEVFTLAWEHYQEALRRGVAKECARMVLPLATRTRIYMKGSIRSWVTYFMARLAPETQKEHRDVARAAFSIFREQFPVTAEAVFPEEVP